MEFENPQTKKWREFKSAERGFPNGLKGHILYDGTNNMSVHLVPKDYENTDLMFPSTIEPISNEALRQLAVSYTYFATYTIDENKEIIEHKRISHSNPAKWNESVKRKYSLVGDTLTLEPIEKEFAGTRLRWIKVSN